MYFPYLRGRQYELIAIRELVEAGLLSDKVIPIIEPVKLSPTLNSTILTFNRNNKQLSYIINPKVGNFHFDRKKEPTGKKYEILLELIKDSKIIKSLIVDTDILDSIEELKSIGVESSDVMALILNRDNIMRYEEQLTQGTLYNVIPFDPAFRRIMGNRIMIDDSFPRKSRNTDYANQDDNFFSDSHLFFSEYEYLGFSDYTIVGNDYQETGFAPYAVAIHIVYFDSTDNSLRVHHFVSDSNDDINDPAAKFGEAVAKLVSWNKSIKLNTLGIRIFEEMHRTGAYPGLGVAKKLSIMHHLELMSNYLDGK